MGEVVELKPLNKLSNITCVNGHDYSKLRREGDAYFSKTPKPVENKNHETKRGKPTMSQLWKEASGRN